MKEKILITSLGSSGEGVGALTSGIKVFVEGALPSEEVIVEITEQKKNYALGTLVSIEKTSLNRSPPPCPLFNQCGGCQLMHLSYEGQLNIKRQKVLDSLQRIGGLTCEVPSCIPSPLSLHYRNKIQLPVIWEQGSKKIGLFQKNSHSIIPIQKCLIQSALGNEILSLVQTHVNDPSIRYVLIRTTLAGRALIVFVTDGKNTSCLKKSALDLLPLHPALGGLLENCNPRSDNVILGPDFKLLAGEDLLSEQMEDLLLSYRASSFFQVNPLQAIGLYKMAIEWAEIKNTDTVIDAYCGVGALALHASKQAKEVIGIEYVSAAVEDAANNAKQNHRKNCKFVCGASELLLARYLPAEVIFLNPPRKGCDLKLLSLLGSKKPRSIIYISCDPATLARDAKILSSFGFCLKKIQPFDMFPQTAHVETLALFEQL